MLRYQLSRLFGRMWFLFAAFAAVLIASHIFALNRSGHIGEITDEVGAELDKLCAETADMSLDERYAYVSRLVSEQDSPRAEAIAEYQNQLINVCYAVSGVKEYIQNGEGFRSVNIPANLEKYPELYKSIDEPKSINGLYFKRYLRMAGLDLTPVFILLLVGAFIADTCEKGIDRQIKLAYRRSSFFAARELTLTVTVIILCISAAICDLAFSGLLTHTEYLSAPIQSVDHYVWFPQNLTIGGAVLWTLCAEIIGSLISYAIFVFIARRAGDIRRYLIISSAMIAAVTVASDRIPGVNMFGFTGINNKESIFLNAEYLPSFKTSTLMLPIMILSAVLIVISAVRLVRFRFGKG